MVFPFLVGSSRSAGVLFALIIIKKTVFAFRMSTINEPAVVDTKNYKTEQFIITCILDLHEK